MSLAGKSAILTSLNSFLIDGRRPVTGPSPTPANDVPPVERIEASASRFDRASAFTPEPYLPLPSHDARYARFVEAVQALRMDLENTNLSPAEVKRLMESARLIFKLDDGVPGPVQPPEPEPEPDPVEAARGEAPPAGAGESDAVPQSDPTRRNGAANLATGGDATPPAPVQPQDRPPRPR